VGVGGSVKGGIPQASHAISSMTVRKALEGHDKTFAMRWSQIPALLPLRAQGEYQIHLI
jgi:hypothetical protein